MLAEAVDVATAISGAEAGDIQILDRPRGRARPDATGDITIETELREHAGKTVGLLSPITEGAAARSVGLAAQAPGRAREPVRRRHRHHATIRGARRGHGARAVGREAARDRGAVPHHCREHASQFDRSSIATDVCFISIRCSPRSSSSFVPSAPRPSSAARWARCVRRSSGGLSGATSSARSPAVNARPSSSRPRSGRRADGSAMDGGPLGGPRRRDRPDPDDEPRRDGAASAGRRAARGRPPQERVHRRPVARAAKPAGGDPDQPLPAGERPAR